MVDRLHADKQKPGHLNYTHNCLSLLKFTIIYLKLWTSIGFSEAIESSDINLLIMKVSRIYYQM